eukprot:TRINITY_DN33286_c0_g1_i5.p1 TRINITY_DN33286_c0_g1~~TRINITY_DN33286_c0_g1_i5.p1  ORF type:complete len:240 (-),score=-15.02 TRINITY_DN33286_c0_g1_i5:100-819(-)
MAFISNIYRRREKKRKPKVQPEITLTLNTRVIDTLPEIHHNLFYILQLSNPVIYPKQRTLVIIYLCVQKPFVEFITQTKNTLQFKHTFLLEGKLQKNHFGRTEKACLPNYKKKQQTEEAYLLMYIVNIQIQTNEQVPLFIHLFIYLYKLNFRSYRPFEPQSLQGLVFIYLFFMQYSNQKRQKLNKMRVLRRQPTSNFLSLYIIIYIKEYNIIYILFLERLSDFFIGLLYQIQKAQNIQN